MKRLLAALLGTAAGLLLCESAVRLLSDRLLSLQHPAVRFDPELGWVQRAGVTAVRHNEAGEEIVLAGSALGIRQPATSYAIAGRDVVLLLGDSLTAGTQVKFEDTWGAQLQEALRRRHSKVEVVNAGIDRFDLSQEYRLARRLWGTLRPRAVVLAVYVGNDLLDYDRVAQARPPWQSGGPWTWLREHSYLVHYVQGLRSRKHGRLPEAATAGEPDRVKGWSPRSVAGFESLRPEEQARIRGQFSLGDVLPVLRGGSEGERRLAATERVVEAAAALARERGAAFLLLVLPMKQEVIPAQRAELLALHGLEDEDLERPHRHLAAFAVRSGIAVLDATAGLRREGQPEDLYWPVDLHMTPRGHLVLARLLAPAVDEALAPTPRTGSAAPTS